MADQTIDIPGDPGVQLYQGDKLTINFKSPAKFCVTQGDPNCFDPPLPVGVAEPKDHKYVGKVVCVNATILYTHVSHDGNCSGKKEVPPGTIKIGTGINK
jgi:hypothetical protein